MGDIVIEEINYKAIIFSLINAAVFLAAISLAVYGFDHDSVRCWLSGMIISFVISFFLIGSLFNAIRNKKLIIITRDGIIDNSSISGVGYISFDDIKEFKIVTIYNKKAIAVIPKNMDNFISEFSMNNPAKDMRAIGRKEYVPESKNLQAVKKGMIYSMVKRRVIKRNLNQDLPPVTIYVNRAKNIAPEDILSLLQKRLSDVSSLDC